MVQDGTPCNGGSNICYSGQCVARPPAGSSPLLSSITITVAPPSMPSSNFSASPSNGNVEDFQGAHSAVGDGYQLALVIIPSVIVALYAFHSFFQS
jgi:hypothetical protein